MERQNVLNHSNKVAYGEWSGTGRNRMEHMNGRPRGRFHAAITRWFSDPTTGRGQPRANRTGRQRHRRLPSAPRRGGGNAEFGCRLAPVYRTTGIGRNAGSCRPPELLFEVYGRQVAEGGVSPAFHCPHSGSRMACESRLALRAGGRGAVPSWTRSPQHRGSCFFLALVMLVGALGAQICTARKIKAGSAEVDVRHPPHAGIHVKAR